ncbi:DUF1540 domain-containing protein [Romboutsia sp.]|uniref:DUF1540 domain-containing protein n=1 Tax=Romboutsia sp. TaxID=1965302 RepID=UPI003F344034
MSNSNLNCSVSNCAHNNGGACFAGSINVAGSSATTTSSTSCSSYEDKSASGFTNCAGGCSCTKTSNISCQAGNCKHNSLGSCTASNVQINAQNASCETFISE